MKLDFTSYVLEIDTNENLYDEFLEGNEFARYALTSTVKSKWESHENDLKEFSKIQKDILFTLYGEGEPGNLWIKYFKNGKIQFAPADISFDEFDNKKLK